MSLAPEVDKTIARSITLETFWLDSRNRQNNCQKYPSADILVLAPELDKMMLRSIDLGAFWAADADKVRTRSIDLETFWLWFQNSINDMLGPELITQKLQDGSETEKVWSKRVRRLAL